MSKIKSAGKGFIQIGASLINLTQYKTIEKYTFGYDEDPEGHDAYGIMATPLNPSEEDIENGVEGTVFIATYNQDEEDVFEEDFKMVLDALKETRQ